MTKSRNLATSAAVCVAALVAVAVPTLPAYAASTTVSFTLTGGSLTVAQDNGTVVVDDARGGLLGWTVSGASTVPDASGGATAVSYATGPIVTTGVVTAASQSSATEVGATPTVLVVGSGVTGNNTARWTPTVTVLDSPAAAAQAGVTVTHSIM